MEFTSESHEQYREAYAMATRYQQKNQKQGLPVRPVALESLLNERMISCRIDLGVLEIPTSMIVGVAEETEGAGLYTKEFLYLRCLRWSDRNSGCNPLHGISGKVLYLRWLETCKCCKVSRASGHAITGYSHHAG